VSGPTGSGKTSTAAALLQEINLAESRHIITLESPIEYALTPRRAFIRQREVGRDTPSFEQGLFDAMREDPDVIFVGEMRDPEVMRLTLNAAETGHLVIATVHSATVAEALHRMVSAFPAESQAGICAQLGDALLAVVAQHLVYHDELGMRVPECEVLVANSAARSVIRQGQISKLPTVIETSAEDGSWSLMRYRAWLAAKKDWSRGVESASDEDSAELAPPPEPEARPVRAEGSRPAVASRPASRPAATAPPAPEGEDDRVLVLDDTGDDPSTVLAEIERRSGRGR
jgi:twitching motility protein PilT